MTVAPEGFEFAETSAAKNITYDALYRELEVQGFDQEDFDLIEIADTIVEDLLKAGIIIPEDIVDPHGVR